MENNLIKNLNINLDDAGKAAVGFLQSVLGDPLAASGELLTDQIRFLQWKNRIRIAEKALEILKEKGLSVKSLPPGFILPFLRDCGDTSEELLQDAWAQLLAGSIEDEDQQHIAFVNVLKQLSASDAKVLRCLLEAGPYDDKELRINELAGLTELSALRVELSFANLRRLWFFGPTGMKFTPFAIHFIRICIADSELIEMYLKKQDRIPSLPITE